MGRITTAAYDAGRRQSLRHDPRNYVSTYSHDARSSLTGRLYPDGPVGNRTQMRDTTGRYTYTYDPVNRQESKRNPASKATTYGYDPAMHRPATMLGLLARDPP